MASTSNPDLTSLVDKAFGCDLGPFLRSIGGPDGQEPLGRNVMLADLGNKTPSIEAWKEYMTAVKANLQGLKPEEQTAVLAAADNLRGPTGKAMKAELAAFFNDDPTISESGWNKFSGDMGNYSTQLYTNHQRGRTPGAIPDGVVCAATPAAPAAAPPQR